MLARIAAIAMNTYREAVRARVLAGLLVLALATGAYAVVVASLSLHQETRVVADVGAASLSLYAVLAAVVLGAVSLYHELELRTLFPILARPLRRHEYLVGKYLGTLATLTVFVCGNAAIVLVALAFESGEAGWKIAAALAGSAVVLALALLRARRARVFVFGPWCAALAVVAYALAAGAAGDRQVVVASAALTICEVGIVAAVASLFASFSSPPLTLVFTLGVFVIGRSADTLANLPVRVFGPAIAAVGRALAYVVPNLHVYVPARPLLLGEVPESPVWGYVGGAAAHAFFYATVLLTLSALLFRRRDFP